MTKKTDNTYVFWKNFSVQEDMPMEAISNFMAAFGQGETKRANLYPLLQRGGICSLEDAKQLIKRVLSTEGADQLKVEADKIHPHLTVHLSAETVAATVANSIAALHEIPGWEKLPTKGIGVTISPIE